MSLCCILYHRPFSQKAAIRLVRRVCSCACVYACGSRVYKSFGGQRSVPLWGAWLNHVTLFSDAEAYQLNQTRCPASHQTSSGLQLPSTEIIAMNSWLFTRVLVTQVWATVPSVLLAKKKKKVLPELCVPGIANMSSTTKLYSWAAPQPATLFLSRPLALNLFLRLQLFNRVPHVVVTPPTTIKLFRCYCMAAILLSLWIIT